jgi:hypothetical protein
MTDLKQRSTTRPDVGEMEKALHIVNGLFKALDWINAGLLDDDTTAQERVHVTHELVLAGRMITDRICEDF